MGVDDESFLDLLDGGNYDMDELDVDKILGVSTKGESVAKKSGEQKKVKPQQPPQQQSPPKPSIPAEDDAMGEDVVEAESSGRPQSRPRVKFPGDDGEESQSTTAGIQQGGNRRPRIEFPDEQRTTTATFTKQRVSSRVTTGLFKFGGVTNDEARMQRKLRFSNAPGAGQRLNARGGGGELDDVRARRAARFGTTVTATTAAGDERARRAARFGATVTAADEGAKRRAAASGGADAETLKRLGVPMKESKKDVQ